MATDKSYIGKGKVYLDGRQVGNVTALSFALAEEKIELTDYTSAGGGNYNSVSRIDSVTVNMTLSDYSGENLAAAVFGSTDAVTAGTISPPESLTAPASLTNDPLVTTANVIDTDQTVTVTSDPAGTTYVADTDYRVTSAGIEILSTGSINASDALLITYDKKPVDAVQALVTTAQEYEVDFVGLNEAQSGAPVVIKIHRFKPGPAADLGVISDEFAELAITGDALKDTTKNGTTVSQYFEVKSA